VTDAGGRRPLDGLKVLDFSHAVAGPFTSLWLADLGAETIKIEKPGRGDGARHMGEPMLGPLDSDYFVSVNTNKRSVLLDLHKDDGVAIAQSLAAKCDIVVENFRPDVMDRLKLGFKDLSVPGRGLIYCSISAFGSTGPWKDRPANDIIMQGISGMMSITGEPDGDPVRVGSPISDFSTGLFGLSGVLAALHVRPQFPDGQHIKVNMLDSTTALMANYIPSAIDLGREIPRLGRGHPQIVPYQAFRCSDDGYVIVGAFTQGFWRRFCGAVGHKEWITDVRFADNAVRLVNRSILVPMIEAIMVGRSRAHWTEVLAEFDVPHTPVQTLRESLASEQAANNLTTRPVVDADGKTIAHTVANPIRSTQWREPANRAAPTMGDSTLSVLTELLQMDGNQVTALADAGVIGLGE
jgi:crotonobetainyl-CoA:carnitine CoA-transferase CaiB-like acyl-CoA transferase